MKKKGFTLVELIAVLAILAVLTLVSIPLVINQIRKFENENYLEQIVNIENAAMSWFTEQGIELLPNEEIQINLMQLKQMNYVEDSMINEVTKREIPNDSIVKITNNNGINYTFEEGVISNEYTNEYAKLEDELFKIISYDEVTEFMTSTDTMTATVNNSSVPYTKDGTVEDTIGSYYITYSAINNGNISLFRQTILVRDYVAPVVSFGAALSIDDTEIHSYDFEADLIINDISDYTVVVEANLAAIHGVYTIKYIVTDYYGNQTIEYRDVTVR